MALSAFAVAAPGIEPLAAAELRLNGITHATAEAGGVAFDATDAELARVLLNARTITRVLVRAAQFRAITFAQLEQRARTIPWGTWVSAGSRARFRVTCRKSKLYHSDAVAQRLASSLVARVPGVEVVESAASDDDEDGTAQLFVVRMASNVCTVSVDAAGDPLYKRGYRQAVAKAPLRETLAAAMLLGAGWTGASALYDPMCGSGTLVIEGALIARRMAPGLGRAFAAERWPSARGGAWRAARAAAVAAVLPRTDVPLAGSDRDAGAIAAANANAERAGVANDVAFTTETISAVRATAEDGLLVTNPPYGIRVGESLELRDLYARLGHVARESFAGWMFAVLSADRSRGQLLDRQIRLKLEEAWRSMNGGIPVRLLVGRIPRHLKSG